jgi:hypothetical protein
MPPSLSMYAGSFLHTYDDCSKQHPIEPNSSAAAHTTPQHPRTLTPSPPYQPKPPPSPTHFANNNSNNKASASARVRKTTRARPTHYGNSPSSPRPTRS